MPSDKKKFINPLTQPTTTETETEPATQMPTQTDIVTITQSQTEAQMHTSTLPPTQTGVEPSTNANTYTSSEYIPRKRGKQAFERTHQRITSWLDKRLYKQLDALAKREEVAKSTLLDEAVADLLKKHERK